MRFLTFAAAAIASALFANTALAQSMTLHKVSYGIRGGLNFASFTAGTDATENDVRLGFLLGPYMKIRVNDWIFIQPEMTYSLKGGTYKSRRNVSDSVGSPEAGYIYKVSLGYVDLPVLTTIRIAKIMNVQFGPQFSYLINASLKERKEKVAFAPYNLVGNAERFNRYDISAIVGTGVELGAFNFTVRYAYGFIPVAPAGRIYENVLLHGDDKHNSILSLSAGIEF